MVSYSTFCVIIGCIVLLGYIWNYLKPQYQESDANEIMGRAGWTMLHRTALHFPINPTDQERADMIQWIQLWGRVYPCQECRTHLQCYLTKNPIDATTKESLITWTWKLHNAVNFRLNKPVFPLAEFMKVWGEGSYYECKHCLM